MKYTLLELTQTILSSMDSDEINSIQDSVESQQVVKLLKTTYFDIISRANLPEHMALKNLQAGGDSTKPVLMYVPAGVSEIEWLKYNLATTENPEITMTLMTYVPADTFMDRMDRMDETDTASVGTFNHTIGTDTYKFLYYKDRVPSVYTSFDDYTVVFDAVDTSIEASLQASKTKAYCKTTPTWTENDSFVPDLDDTQTNLLLNEAKSLAWAELKQSPHVKAEQNARRAWVHLNKNKNSLKPLSDFDKLPSFGRR